MADTIRINLNEFKLRKPMFCARTPLLNVIKSVNQSSYVLVCRNKAMRHAVCPSFIVNGVVIPESDKVKYLGYIICSDLSDDEDTMRQRRYLYAQGNVLSRSFHMCSINVNNINIPYFLYSNVYMSPVVEL